MDDIRSADIVFLTVNTYNALRAYELADEIRRETGGLVVLGGLHASLNYPEAVQHADIVLLGEGDESIVDLLKAADEGNPMDFAGAVYIKNGKLVHTGERALPEGISTIPDRSLVYAYAKAAKTYNTLWPQVHASRGCPHSCDYCAVVRHFGRRIRKRSPENVVEDIRQAIAFHERGNGKPRRMNHCVWITDDNFPEDREWAMSVLRAIADADTGYKFSVQARYEAGFDDELLGLMRKAGFIELALGIEFIDDAAFGEFHKKSTRDEIVRAIANIKRHGIGVRGLFILGADHHKKGAGRELARFVEDQGIHGALIQAMFFTPGTPAYERKKDALLHEDWSKYRGHAVHRPAQMSPADLQREVIKASALIYSPRKLLKTLFTAKGIMRTLFIGEFFWHMNVRRELRGQLKYLESFSRENARALTTYDEKKDHLTEMGLQRGYATYN
jgi:radical SAM superfamily enzyme YgiQ (UPF0313 family)